MYDRGLSSELDIVDFEYCRACLRSSEELDVKGYRMGLVLLCERGVEVCGNDFKYASSDVSAIWYYVV
jgi:hypothetical protein